MKKAIIDPIKCDNSPFCPVRRICPVKAVERKERHFEVNASLCTGCGKCVRVCPMKAVSIQ